MFSTAGRVFVAATVPLLLQLVTVAKALGGIAVTAGNDQPIARFNWTHETDTGYQAVLFFLDPSLPAMTYDMERDNVHGWFVHGDDDQHMALRFNGKLHRGDKPTGNLYEYIDSTQVQVEFVGEKRVVSPANPQQAQQQGNPQYQYPLYTVSGGFSFSSGPILRIEVLMALKPLVGHPGLITTVDNPPQVVGHFTWAAEGSAHDGMVEVTSTSTSLPSRPYKVKLDPKHGWVLQGPGKIYVLVPNGALYRERVGGGEQHIGPGGHVENKVIGTYEWDTRRLGYVKVFLNGEEAPEEGEHDADPIYKATAMESPPHRWHIIAPFTLKPKAPPIDTELDSDSENLW